MIKLDLTVKSKAPIKTDQLRRSFIFAVTDYEDEGEYRGRYQNPEAYNLLPNPLDLKGIKPGEERRGELVYSITKYLDQVGGVEENVKLVYTDGGSIHIFFE